MPAFFFNLKTMAKKTRKPKRKLTSVSTGRVKTRGLRSELRAKRREARIRATDVKRRAKMSVKQAKKLKDIYGELSPEEVNAINEVQPLLPAMQDELDRKGIEYDEEDPIETSVKFAQTTDEIEDPMDQEDYDELYCYENLDEAKKGKLRNIVKGVTSFAVGGINALTREAQDKKAMGMPLSRTEDALVTAKEQAITTAKKQYFGESGKYIIPVILVVLLLWIIWKK